MELIESNDCLVVVEENPESTSTQNHTRESEQLSSDYRYLEHRMRRLHGGFLFYRKSDHGKTCAYAFKTIVSFIGGTHPTMSGWRDLAACLEISPRKINYIDYSMREKCPTETALKVFVQTKDATLDILIMALVEIGRKDVISAIENPLLKLYESLISSDDSEDLGYSTSSSNKDEETWDVITPKYIPNDLPEVLLESDSEDDDEKCSMTEYDINHKFSKPFLMFTYADDGISYMRSIRKEIEMKDIHRTIDIVTLESLTTQVQESPELIIPILCEKALYIIPILTKGYLDRINSTEEVLPSSMDNKDDAYVRYVYTQMTGEYIGFTGCLNKKVRSILPDHEDTNIIRRLHNHPVLRAWTREKDLTKFLIRLGIFNN